MSADAVDRGTDRRQFLARAAATGAGVVAGGSALDAIAPSLAQAKKNGHGHSHSKKTKKGDLEILEAAQIAEALAVTTYTNIINTAPFFTRLESDDQGYLKAARQEEMSHYLLEEGVTKKPSPFTSFYYPPKMFADAQTTLNVLVTLEDAFIAAYLVGVRDFSTADLRVTAARIMGIESDHRTLARVVAPGEGRERRSPEQQRLRAHAALDVDQQGCRSADAVCEQERGRKSGLRHEQGVQVRTLHADAARAAGRIPLVPRLRPGLHERADRRRLTSRWRRSRTQSTGAGQAPAV